MPPPIVPFAEPPVVRLPGALPGRDASAPRAGGGAVAASASLFDEPPGAAFLPGGRAAVAVLSDGVGAPPLPAPSAHPPPFAPETLHPALWRGHQLGRVVEQGVPSGFAALDAQLPGGGWPRRALSELLLPHLGIGEVRLVAPALAEVQRAGRLVMLFDPPAVLSGWALAQLGLDVEQLLLIHAAVQVPVEPGRVPAGPSRQVGVQARLWALEQALKSGHVGAVLAWLPPRLSPDRLRRLQLAAHAHDGPAFVLRELAAQPQPSASPLRLGLRAAGVDQLAVNVLKRRGPPLLQPVHLVLPAMLPAAALRRAQAPASPDTADGNAGPRRQAVGAPAGAAGVAADHVGAAREGDGRIEAEAEARAPGVDAGPSAAPGSERRSDPLRPATFINLA